MQHDITIQNLGEGVEEATFAEWLKQVGDEVTTDEPIAELMTDKVNLELVSPFTGVLTAQLCEAEDVVAVGAVIAHIESSS